MAASQHSTMHLVKEFIVSGVSVGTATTFTNPLDVIKTRLQLSTASALTRPGLVQVGISVVQKEGVIALWNGLPPSLARGLVYGGIRLGAYSPIKTILTKRHSDSAGFTTKLLSGTLSGGFAAAVSSPTELIKTRLQAPGIRYASSAAVVREVIAADGVRGLWKGATPGIVRAAVLTASQCATYDEVKRAIMHTTGWSDHAGTHFVCSMVTGLVTTTATNPVDVVKTYMFMGGSRYSSPMQCAAGILHGEGLAGFFKGWAANYARLGPQTVIIFLVAEKLRAFAGLGSL